MGKRRIFRNMPQKQLPLSFKPIIECLIIRYIEPLLAELKRICNIRIPDRTRGIYTVLRPAFTQAADCTAQSAIHLQAEEFIAVDAKRPRGINLRDDATVE